jgi:hypothetical protein
VKRFNKLAVAAVGFLVCTAAPAATAEDSSAQSNSNENQAEVQFDDSFGDSDSNGERVSTRSAGGGTWAPGGAGARVTIGVEGNGLELGKVHVSYYPSFEWKIDNVCGTKYELAYDEPNGNRKVIPAGPKGCTPVAMPHEHKYDLSGVHAKDGSKTCGRVYVDAKKQWSPWACVTMKK